MKRFGVIALIPLLTLLIRPDLTRTVAFSRVVYDANHRLLRVELTPDQKYRMWATLGDISPKVVDATLMQEDQHFRHHYGINVFSLLRAAFFAVTPGHRRIGASTITMQLARVRYRIYSKSMFGKINQIARALQIELHYSKNDILEAYLNLVPYGGNVEGVAAASLVYFGKRPDKLNLVEAMTLAVIPQSPHARAPEKTASGALAKARRELFGRWVALHPDDKGRALEIDMTPALGGRAKLPFLAPHFVTGLPPSDRREVTTTLDLGLQRILERQATSYIEHRAGAGLKNTSAILVDYRTMEVKAVLGSVDFHDAAIEGQVNGTRGKRSPGSTLKPFLYAMGIEQGLIHPMTMLKDTPLSFAEYDPENFDRDFVGPIKVKDALTRSRNVPALWVANRLKPGLYSFLKDAGVSQLREESFYGLALALGGAEMTMEELARLYAALANGGVMRPLRFTKDAPAGEEKRLFSPEASFLVLDMLKDNPRPNENFRRDWVRDDLAVAWKTGTSWGFRDAWTMAVFGPYVLGVWVGNFDGEPNPALVGRDAAAPLLFRIVDAIKADRKLAHPQFAYDGTDLKQVRVCAVSGEMPGPFCKHTLPTWFIPGKSPIHTCAIHREVKVDPKTGNRACDPNAAGVVSAVFEFWPSDLLKLFRQAGIPRRVPPAEGKGCALEARGTPPEITSPRRELEYTLRAGLMEADKIPLAAVTDSDARTLYWFIDERFVGKAPAGETFFWAPRAGRFIVRVVDDQGRADARELKVGVVQ